MARGISVGIGLFLTILAYRLGTVYCFKDGAPFDMCKYKGNAFHTREYNKGHVEWIQPRDFVHFLNPEPSPYQLVAEKHTYRKSVNRKGNKHTHVTADYIRVTLSVKPGAQKDHFKGFYIKAIPENRGDKDPRAYGTFAVLDDKGDFVVKNNDAESVLCYVLHWYSDKFPIGGVSHTNNTEKKELTVYWFPPINCNVGRVIFEATVVFDYSTYWSNVHSNVIRPEGFGRRTYPACEYYRDPLRYYKKVKRLQEKRKEKKAKRQRGKKTNRKETRDRKNRQQDKDRKGKGAKNQGGKKTNRQESKNRNGRKTNRRQDKKKQQTAEKQSNKNTQTRPVVRGSEVP